MRILRGQSSSEVSSQGFALFVLGLIVATFVGGAVRTLLNSDSIQKQLLAEAQRRWPDVSIEIGKMRGHLSQGIWPGLAFHFENLKLVKRSCRGDSFQIEIDRLVAPIKLTSLWNKSPKLGDVEAGFTQVHLFRQPCADNSEREEAEVSTSSASSSEAPVTTVRPIDWTPARKIFDGISIQDLEFTSEAEPSLKTVLHRLTIDVSDELKIRGDVELKKALPYASLSHQMILEARADEKNAQLNLRGKFKEGSLNWQVTIDLLTQKFQQKLSMHQLPTKELLAELFRLGFVSNETILKSFWLTCEASQDGVLSQWKREPVAVHDCKLDGSGGTVQLSAAQFNLIEKRPINPVTIEVQNLQIGPVLEALRRDTMPMVFSKLGAWTGSISLQSLEDWQLNGVLKGVEIIFSSQSVRGKQIVQSISAELKKSAMGIQGRVSSIELADGKAEGSIQIRFDPSFKNGDVHLDFSNFVLSSSVQKILFGGTMSELKLNATGHFLIGELSDLSLRAQTPKLDGEGWSLRKVATQVGFKSNVADVRVTADSFVANDQWSQIHIMKSIYEPREISAVQWSDLSAKFEINRTGGEVEQLVARERNLNWRILGRGKWRRDHDLTGSLQVSGEKVRKLYSVLGRQNQLSLRLE